MKNTMETILTGKKVRIKDNCDRRSKQYGTVVNVYLSRHGTPLYDVLFEDGLIETEMYSFDFQVIYP